MNRVEEALLKLEEIQKEVESIRAIINCGQVLHEGTLAVAAMEKSEPADHFHDWPVKPGMWVESSVYGPIKLYALGSGLSHAKAEGFVIDKNQAKSKIQTGVWRILTPEEVKAHERKIGYPVLAPGDMVETNHGNIFKVRKAASSDFIEVCDGLYTQKDAAYQLEFGYWVKYVREVKP